MHLLHPIFAASATFFIVIGAVSIIAPTDSLVYSCIVLCGTIPGYTFALLFLTWIFYVIRLILRFGSRLIEEIGLVPCKGRYRALPVAEKDLSGSSKCKVAGDGIGDLLVQGTDEWTCTPAGHGENDVRSKFDPQQRRGRMLRYDCAIIVVLYALMCFLAWLFWSPPSFNVEEVASRDATDLTFPPSFQFGAATSSYQVEGNIYNNQWAEFEDNPAGEHILNGQHCGAAADMWNRFDSDLEDCILPLGVDAFRLSVEWARIEPERGVFNDTAIDRYAYWVSKLRESGVEPIVTLHHFTNPSWFEQLGAFENPSAPEIILPFVERVVSRLGAHVDRWITINEIMVYAGNGYLMGEFPPGRSGELGTMLRVVATMLRTHEGMYHAIKNIKPNASISIAKNTILYEPWSFLDLIAVVSAAISDLYYNAMPMRILQQQRSIDFMGINTYIRLKVGFLGSSMGFVFPKDRQSDMGWDLEPQVLYRVVKQYHKYSPELDIFITEHGVADGENPDLRRVSFLRDSLLGLVFAINHDERVPVVGYMHWSLLDNWEWSSGYIPKFGLFRIDLPNSQERQITEGGKLYRSIVESRQLPAEN